MDIFEYLPQLIVAYDGNDKFANLIHVKKADKDNDYYCPCCGGMVKPRALDSSKEQSHYYHITGKCTKESQLHFFCKNWLFETGSKFYINKQLFEVASIDIEKSWKTKFGYYKPDVTVYTTSGNIFYFEMFFANRKTDDDYFCIWNDLGNDVVEVNIKEYMYKTEQDSIPVFTYLYHDGKCYSKTYLKRDLYANTIAKIKRELTRQKVLNYKARIEQLDWFWQKIKNNDTAESILCAIESMEYDDMLSCYDIIKRKQCVSYLKDTVLETINTKVLSSCRDSIGLPNDENVYFDLRHMHGRTYEAGIRLKIKTKHIQYDDFYSHCSFGYDLEKCKEYPKIVFNTKIFTPNELVIPKDRIDELKSIFDNTVAYKNQILEYETIISDFEGEKYKIRMNNNYYTVLAKIHDDNFEVIMGNYYIEDLDIRYLSDLIQQTIQKINDMEFFSQYINSNECAVLISELQNYRGSNCRINITYEEKTWHGHKAGIYFRLYLFNQNIYEKSMSPTAEEFINTSNLCKKIIDSYMDKYSGICSLVDRINNCTTGIWSAEFKLSYYNLLPEIEIDQKIIDSSHFHFTSELVKLYDGIEITDEIKVIRELEKGMRKVLKNMEKYGYRILEVQS